MITTDDALASLCEAVRAFPAIALDTEFVRTRTYYPQLGLIQLFDGEHLALIDPLGITDWSPLKAILRDPSITKFLHAGSEDRSIIFSVWLQSVWYWAIIERTRSSACGAAIFLPHIVRVCHAVCLAKVYC